MSTPERPALEHVPSLISDQSRPLIELTDVLIAGSGSAGLCAALWLSRHRIPYRILERRPGHLQIGQADSVQCRTVEILESFGLAEDMLREAYHVLEVAFWSAVEEGAGGAIRRTEVAADTEPGLSHLPHVILNQARVHELMIGEIERAAGGLNVEYGCEVLGVAVDGDVNDPQAYAVGVVAVKDGEERKYRAKYVLVGSWFSPLRLSTSP
jgi:phenol 2-monooxygenase